MTIETTLVELCRNSERVASALERIARAFDFDPIPGPSKSPSPAPEPQESDAPAPSPAPKAKTKPATRAPAKAEGPTKDDVRNALKAVQRAATPAKAKALLSAYDATTLSDLDEGKYQDIIDAASAVVSAAEEDE